MVEQIGPLEDELELVAANAFDQSFTASAPSF
jgi:hypothetical protein